MEAQANYNSWSNEKLIERVTQLEKELKSKNASSLPNVTPKNPKKPRDEGTIDPSKYSTRLVAFKLAYLGKRYNGYEHHKGNKTPFPTIEEELWKAFNKARLIFPKGGRNQFYPGEPDWEGLEYSKCGRTDKGVSAFGQVIGIRVRSARPLGKRKLSANEGEPSTHNGEGNVEIQSRSLSPPRYDPCAASERPQTPSDDNDSALDFDPIADEIPYCSLLNRLLPPDIRILAWCPFPPLDFSARFSCRERQYRYFFTQPAFAPMAHHLEAPPNPNQTDEVGRMKDGWLNIDAMRRAANLFEGVHDFRNFCKVDGSKQIENFERVIFKADIEEVEDVTPALGYLNSADFLPGDMAAGNPKVYTFTLHGSAFLWHQVRCMVSILFLVAQGLEPPEIVTQLLDVEKTPRRPVYEMATDTPLVLWDCIFPKFDDPDRKDAIEWIHIGSSPNTGELKFGTDGIMENLWKVWRERKVDELLAQQLMGVVFKQGKDVGELTCGREVKGGRSQKVFDGGNRPRLQGTYTRVMKKELMASPEVVNEKYARRKGYESSADLKQQGYKLWIGKGNEAGGTKFQESPVVVDEEQMEEKKEDEKVEKQEEKLSGVESG